MVELRTHLTWEEFQICMARQQAAGYEMVFLESDGIIRSVAGFRIGDYLAWGKILYIDDLVTRAADRGHGFGRHLLDWLAREALARGCAQLHLDSGVQRFAAHRFYLGKGMDITAHHFAVDLSLFRLE